jgi:hypothetical protein
MKSFWWYLTGSFWRPARVFRHLQTEPKRLAKGLKAILLIGVLYTFTVAALAAGGALISAPAFLPISLDNYYFWEIFFALPVLVLAWILAAVFARILGSRRGSRGQFRNGLATLGFAFAVPQFLMWIVETTFAVLLLLGMTQEEFMELSAQPGTWQTLVIGYQVLAVVWMLALTVVAVGISQRLRWWKAMIAGLLTTALFLTVMIIIIR